MDDAVFRLYEAKEYPAMSHPATDPAVAAVAAAVAGLPRVSPESASVLEIGCSSGWNLLPMADAHPGASHAGLELSARALATAREVAAAAGIRNTEWIEGDFRDWQPRERFDRVIAHGVYSWVAADARPVLLERIRSALTATGFACVGFNTMAGWAMRRQVVDLARALAVATGDDPAAPLAVLEMLENAVPEGQPHAAHLRWILGDMRSKGRAMLPFDDFAPVCEPCGLSQFAAQAANAGLRLLGESELAANLPEGVEADRLGSLAGNPWLLQEACDVLGGRSHRVLVLCRDDAPLAEGITTEVLTTMAVRLKGGAVERDGKVEVTDENGEARAVVDGGLAARMFLAMAGSAPSCVPVARLLGELGCNGAETARLCGCLFDAARAGLVELRAEPVWVSRDVPAQPRARALRREFARRRAPVVDAWHRPCTLSAEQAGLLVAMDGGRSLEELEALAVARCPGLAFRPWIEHLCERGIVE